MLGLVFKKDFADRLVDAELPCHRLGGLLHSLLGKPLEFHGSAPNRSSSEARNAPNLAAANFASSANTLPAISSGIGWLRLPRDDALDSQPVHRGDFEFPAAPFDNVATLWQAAKDRKHESRGGARPGSGPVCTLETANPAQV